MNIEPLGSRIIVEEIDIEQQPGAIILIDKPKSNTMQGTVLAIGPGDRNEAGSIIPMRVAVGDTILCSKYAGTEVEIDHKKYIMMNEAEVFGIVR